MIQCVALDDEKYALELLCDNIRQFPELELVNYGRNPGEMLEYMEHHSVDLLFTDIQMPMLNGLQLIEKMDEPPMVIVVSAHPDYAVEGFAHNVLDYVLKPIKVKRFRQAVDKARLFYSLSRSDNHLPDSPQIVLKCEYRNIKLKESDIIYIEGLKDYVKVFTSFQSKPIVTKHTIKSIGEILSLPEIVRINKSNIVNMNYLKEFQKGCVYLHGNTCLPLSNSFKENYTRFLDFA